MTSFGKYLTESRLRAGFTNLEGAAKKISKIGKCKISKSLLSLFERDEVGSIQPEIIQAMALAYNESYDSLAYRWFLYKFYPSNSVHDVVSLPTASDPIKIVTLEEFQRIQSKLPSGSQVGIACPRFFDHTIFFDMVLKNLKRNIVYYYFLPEDQYPLYRAFIARVIEKEPDLSMKLDGTITKFISRPNLEYPINFALHIYPDGNVDGYVGLIADEVPQYFQIADKRLSFRLYEGLQWAFLIAKDSIVRKRLADLQSKLPQRNGLIA